jgi:membrane-associated phospholipid phosphatase
MWSRVQRLDRWLMSRSFGARTPTLDRSLVAITRAANYSRLWLLIAGMLAVFGGGRSRRAAGRGLAAIVIAAVVANGPAKLLVRRRRPSSRSRPTLIRMPRSTSFPSGHTAAAFAFATGACAELPVLAPVLVPLAGAVAYSRVHTGVHYPSDVAAGMGIGIGSGLLATHSLWRVHMRERPLCFSNNGPAPYVFRPATAVRFAITTSARSQAHAHRSPPRTQP